MQHARAQAYDFDDQCSVPGGCCMLSCGAAAGRKRASRVQESGSHLWPERLMPSVVDVLRSESTTPDFLQTLLSSAATLGGSVQRQSGTSRHCTAY
jgi:hypothetical protein